jgi:Transposase
MKQSRFTDEQIIGFLKQADAGMSVKELCRFLPIRTNHICRSDVGGFRVL